MILSLMAAAILGMSPMANGSLDEVSVSRSTVQQLLEVERLASLIEEIGCPKGRCAGSFCFMGLVKAVTGTQWDPEYQHDLFDDCKPAPCSNHLCDLLPDNVDLPTLVAEIESLDDTGLRLLLDATPRLVINRSRNALQLMGCSDDVLVSLPLGSRKI